MRDGLTKKLILMGATFLMAVAAYLVFSSPDQAAVEQDRGDSSESSSPAPTPPPRSRCRVSPTPAFR